MIKHMLVSAGWVSRIIFVMSAFSCVWAGDSADKHASYEEALSKYKALCCEEVRWELPKHAILQCADWTLVGHNDLAAADALFVSIKNAEKLAYLMYLNPGSEHKFALWGAFRAFMQVIVSTVFFDEDWEGQEHSDRYWAKVQMLLESAWWTLQVDESPCNVELRAGNGGFLTKVLVRKIGGAEGILKLGLANADSCAQIFQKKIFQDSEGFLAKVVLGEVELSDCLALQKMLWNLWGLYADVFGGLLQKTNKSRRQIFVAMGRRCDHASHNMDQDAWICDFKEQISAGWNAKQALTYIPYSEVSLWIMQKALYELWAKSCEVFASDKQAVLSCLREAHSLMGSYLITGHGDSGGSVKFAMGESPLQKEYSRLWMHPPLCILDRSCGDDRTSVFSACFIDDSAVQRWKVASNALLDALTNGSSIRDHVRLYFAEMQGLGGLDGRLMTTMHDNWRGLAQKMKDNLTSLDCIT